MRIRRNFVLQPLGLHKQNIRVASSAFGCRPWQDGNNARIFPRDILLKM